jgi:hypothetical protein
LPQLAVHEPAKRRQQHRQHRCVEQGQAPVEWSLELENTAGESINE